MRPDNASGYLARTTAEDRSVSRTGLLFYNETKQTPARSLFAVALEIRTMQQQLTYRESATVDGGFPDSPSRFFLPQTVLQGSRDAKRALHLREVCKVLAGGATADVEGGKEVVGRRWSGPGSRWK